MGACRGLSGPVGRLWWPVVACGGLWGPVGPVGHCWGMWVPVGDMCWHVGACGDLLGPVGACGGWWGPVQACNQRNMFRGFRGEGQGLVVRREVVFSLQRGPYVHRFLVMVATPCGFLWIPCSDCSAVLMYMGFALWL